VTGHLTQRRYAIIEAPSILGLKPTGVDSAGVQFYLYLVDVPYPAYHTPVFVLTHHARGPIRMEGGTEFRFVDDIHQALKRAADAAGSKDVRLGGGVSTIRQYLQAGLVDEMHLAIAPVLLGSGEHLLSGIDLPALGYECTEHVPTTGATHVVVNKSR
jgi:dihydrofolate reductase